MMQNQIENLKTAVERAMELLEGEFNTKFISLNIHEVPTSIFDKYEGDTKIRYIPQDGMGRGFYYMNKKLDKTEIILYRREKPTPEEIENYNTQGGE